MPVFLLTDGVMVFLILALLFTLRTVRRDPARRVRWGRVFARPSAAAAAVLLGFFLVIASLDSLHYRPRLSDGPDGTPAYAPVTVSVLETLVEKGLGAAGEERSYSSPFALREFDKTTVIGEAGAVRDFQPLRAVTGPAGGRTHAEDLLYRTGAALIAGLVSAALLYFAAAALLRKKSGSIKTRAASLLNTPARRAAAATLLTLWLCSVLTVSLWPHYHLFGTDAVGNDVLLEALRSVRTAIVIGTLATLATLPFAVTLGIAAGYFKGRTDDVIQYLYTTLSAVPSVLLIAAAVLMATVFMDQHPDWWPTGLERADARLFLLALIIGLTGWATLARLLRAETMKITALDYVTAARAMGVSHARIMLRHVLPNVLHIVLIVTVLDFSGIVLYEAVLSYVGVGVDPTMSSFGTMINAARSEMSRTPMIWWNLLASFLFMLTLVLSANLFASAVRDAFDPRASDGV